jgi:hypothetical protein
MTNMETTEDLKKYFDPKKYITKIIGPEEAAKDEPEKAPAIEEKVARLISLLTDPANKDLKEKALLTLKKEKGEDLLLLAIASPKAKEHRAKLVAACWESEINFSKYLSFFILLALDTDYLVSLEAITVISTMEGPFNKDHVTEGLKKVKAAKKNISDERVVLLNDLIVTLEDLSRD